MFNVKSFYYFSKDDPKKRFPDHLHYSHNDLIPSILILPEPGWLLYDKRLNTSTNKSLGGTHGYDAFGCEEMNTIFFARGPDFKKDITIEPFESVNIYPLLAHLLGINPRPNNGSLSVFKHILKDWSDLEEIQLHGKYPSYIYAIIFGGGILVSLIILAAIYFSLIHFYWVICGRKVRYVKVPRDQFEEDGL